MEEARNRKNEITRNIDSIHFKLQKPNSNDDSKKKKWWGKVLFFFKWKRTHKRDYYHNHEDVHQARARALGASISGPVFINESRNGSSSPYRVTNKSFSGLLNKSEIDIRYLSLRELNMEQQEKFKVSSSAMPLYLVT